MRLLFFALIMVLFSTFVMGHDEESIDRQDIMGQDREKKIGIFNVVKFANDQCKGNSGKNGTCYTKEECTDRKGSAAGTCAKGYGVCCVFTLSCGGMRKENATYFTSTKSMKGPCTAHVCKMNDDIGQIRLDFVKFKLEQPTAWSAPITKAFKILNGVYGTGTDVTVTGTCQKDTFSVTSPGHQGSPVICGSNMGTHLYVEASDACNALNFNIGGTSSEFEIKIMQYTKDYINRAPPGCLQWFFGSASGSVQSFNHGGTNRHLNSQNQVICIRREKNMCRICYHTAATTDFELSYGVAATKGLIGGSKLCGNYALTGKGIEYDYLQIPKASKHKTSGVLVAKNADKFCGVLLASASGKTAASICSKSLPFRLHFRSDDFEFSDKEDKSALSRGFKLAYTQTACKSVT